MIPNEDLYQHFSNKAGHIDEKKLFDVLTPFKRTKRSDSGITPNAQTTKLCKYQEQRDRKFERLQSSIDMLKVRNYKVYVAAILMYSNGLRVSEVLNISSYDITTSGRVHIKGSKGSNDKIIDSGVVKEYMIKCKKLCKQPFEGINRFYVYRLFKQCGIVYDSVNSNKKSITHALRHAFVEDLRQNNISEKEISTAVGHKRLNNTKLYGKSKT